MNQPATFVAHDGNTYNGPPPADWWQANDGRWYPPEMHPQYQQQPATEQWAAPTVGTQSGPPIDIDERPWWRKKRFMIPIGVFILLGIAGSFVDDGDDSPSAAGDAEIAQTDVDPEAAGTSSDFFQPAPRDDSGTFWGTSFGVVAPAGSWEQRESAGVPYCVLLTEAEFRIENDRGAVVADSITFDRTGSEIRADGSCQLRGAAFGDYDNLGSSYALTDGNLAATFTPQELFSGQNQGPDTVKPLN